MEIIINNHPDPVQLAAKAGYENVEEFVNFLLKQEADIQAIREGILDAEAGNARSFDDFDKEFRKKYNINSETT